MQKEFSIAEAKERLPSLIHGVEAGSPVTLTRHGKPVAVLLSLQHFERLQKKKEGFWIALSAFRRVVEKAEVEISDADFDSLRDRSSGRGEQDIL